jgi:H+/Cl- antiporter ClcA
MPADTPGPPAPSGQTPEDPYAPLRSRGYLMLLVFSAVIGVPLAALAYGFLVGVDHLQTLLYTDLPKAVGFRSEPVWWPLPLLAVAGVLVALTIRHLPGNGGHEPTGGFKAGEPTSPSALPGVLLAALASLSLGTVIGPEAPLIALGGGLAGYTIRLVKRDADARTQSLAGASGSFAAVSALLGSPLLGAFLLMEAAGLGGATMGIVMLPGLLASGVGALVFVGLGSWTGFGTVSLTLPDLPRVGNPTLAELGWAVVIGLAAALLGAGIQTLSLLLKERVSRRRLLLSPVAGLLVAGLAIAYAEGSGKPSSEVLFSGQTAVGPLIAHSADYSVGALVLLTVCKSLAYCLSLAAFRGGPVFPAIFLGAAGGIALSHLPGLPLVPAVAIGIGAMGAAMLRLPMTAVLLATLLLGIDGVTVMPLVIVGVVVSHIASFRLTPPPHASSPAPGGAGPAATPRR